MNKRTKILIIGATGNVGGETLRLLTEEPTVDAIAAVRSAEKGSDFRDAGIETRELDLDRPETIGPALEGIDRALLLTGYTVDMLRQSKRFLDAAKVAGTQHIVHIGASGAATNEVAHWGWHQLVESYIEKLGFTWTHLRPEGYMQNVTGPGFRWLNDDVITHFIGDAVWSWVDGRDVAAVAAKALTHPELHGGKVIPLGYDAKTMEEVAAVLTATTGRKITAKSESPDVFLSAAIEGGLDPAYANCVYSQFKLDAAGEMPGAGTVFDNFHQIVGRPPRAWEETAVELRVSL